MRIAICEHRSTTNAGDYIQTLAISKFLEANGISPQYVEREELAGNCLVDYNLILNGWFAHDPARVFPLPRTKSLMVIGFHLAQSAYSSFDKLQRDEWIRFSLNCPIGCRDQKTHQFLTARGINSYYSSCPTILATRIVRKASPSSRNSIVFVDFSSRLIPAFFKAEYSNLFEMSANYPPYIGSDKDRLAIQYLDFINEYAGLLVTTRIHAALPALALGIPVAFFGDPNDPRVSIISELGGVINPYPTSFSDKSSLHKNFLLGPQLFKRLLMISPLVSRPDAMNLNFYQSLLTEKLTDYLKSCN